jgi:predicted small lipoprotein YifL
MSRVPQILVATRARRLALAVAMGVLLAACGQRGPLYLPAGPSADGRATLMQTFAPAPPASAPPATRTASPIPSQ